MQADPETIPENDDRSKAAAAQPVGTFLLERDPLTGEPIEPSYRLAIPVYDAETHEIREWLP